MHQMSWGPLIQSEGEQVTRVRQLNLGIDSETSSCPQISVLPSFNDNSTLSF